MRETDIMNNIVKLSNEEYQMILNNCFSNIFVTDGKGKIIFVNDDAARSLCKSKEYLIGLNCNELLNEGITDFSSTLLAIKNREKVIGSFTNLDGQRVMVATNLIFDKNGDIDMCVTYSRLEDDMGTFLEDLEKEREQRSRYKSLAMFFSETKNRNNEIIFRSNKMKKVKNTAKSLASTETTIMIYGESGTGKEVLARYIHNNSCRKKEIFVPVNCAAIPSELLESEFFGYEKGAFTGANSKGKPGLFEIAQNGTLFLDEIGELPLTMQSKLLRCLETGEFRRVGGSDIIHTKARIIGATNRNLKEMTENREFREDLYYRLNVLTIEIPPLRERKDDIVELAEYFIDKMNQKHNRQIKINESQMKILCEYNWPGNIRELKNIIERYVVTRDENVINLLKLDSIHAISRHVISCEEGEAKDPITRYDLLNQEGKELDTLKERIKKHEREYIKFVLDKENGNKQKTAEILGISRAQLYRKL